MGESTTIDSIQIEIQSNSTNAASGINALATSLGNLKKQTISKTAISNLEQFSNVIKNIGNVHGASNALRTLANSIEKLKGVGTLSSLNKSLTALPTALRTLANVDLRGVTDQARDLADAVSPLSTVKAGGLGTMLRNLSKLEDVTKDLDDTKIKKFAEQVKKVADALGPLSSKMTTVKEGFRGLNTVVRQTNRSLAETNDEVHTGLFNFSNFTNVMSAVVGVIQQVAQGFANVIDSATQWDGIAARFGKGFGSQAQETYEWIQRLNEEMGINVQQFMQYSSIYATMLTGFGVANEDAGKMALGYAELTYDIWAGYNDIYRTFDEAAEAVRSAIAGEVEPVRRAGFTIIESTLQQTAANHGLEISLENATEAQKSYLRYLTLVDQAHAQNLVGTYAKEMRTAEGLMRTLSQQLKSLAQAFGSLFIPMLVKALPYVQAFVELLTEGVHWLASLFGIEIQDISGTWGDYNSGITDAVENTQGVTGALNDATDAAKALKNASIGIDELNVISKPSASSGSGGGAGSGAGGGGFDGLDVDSLWDESIFDTVQNKVDDIKTRLKGMLDEWLPTLQVIGGALAGWSIANLLENLGEALNLTDDFLGKVTILKKLMATAIIITLQYELTKGSFEKFMGENGTLWDYILGVAVSAVGTYLLYALWGTTGLSIGLGITAVASLSAVMEEGGITDVESLTVALTGLASAIGAVAVGWKAAQPAIEIIKEFTSAVKTNAPEVGVFAAMFPKLSSGLASMGTTLSGIGSSLATTMDSLIAGLGALSGGTLAATIGVIAAALVAMGSAVYYVYENWDELGLAIKDFFKENIAPKIDSIKESWEKLTSAVKSAGESIWNALPEGLKDTITDIATAIGGAASAVGEWFASIEWLEGIGTAFEWLGGLVFGVMTYQIAGTFNAVMSAIEGFVQFFSGTVQTIGGVVELIVALFTGDLQAAGDAVSKIGQGISDVFGGLYDMTIGVLVEWVEGVVDWFEYLWDTLVGHSIVPDTINAIVEWFTSLPSKIFASIEEFADGIVERFQGLWSDLKAWWDNKPSLKAYVPSIGDIKSKVSSAWTSAKNWWDKSKATLKEYTPSIGSIYNKLKDRWDNARTWWNDKKTKAKEYTPSIGSIYEKLSERWKNARDWWNGKKPKLSYTPSIGSITDKLKSAWNSAKSWWNKNVSLKTKLNISVPKIKVQWDTATAFGKSFKYPTGFKLDFAADGGIFDQGSLVWAGERGPEVVANAAGGKTGVMNVEQMQEAVYEGVYAAITAAMSGKTEGGTQAVNVYLDGKKITSSVEKHQRERGVSIMGNGVYSY